MRFSPLGGAYWEKLFYAKINLKYTRLREVTANKMLDNLT